MTSSSATFTFSSTIAGSTFACSLDGSAFAACASPVTYNGLGDGTHAFAVAATANSVTDPTPATAGWTVDSTPPTVTATNPTNASTNVPGTTTVSATFSEPMAPASLTGSLTLTDTTTSSAVAGSLAYDGPSQTLTFTPSSALAAGHNFSATQSTAATDLAGNHLASAVTWTFSTATTPPPPPSLFSDGFESGNLAAWSSVNTAGGGTATVQSSTVRSGSFAARFTESTSSGSVANARATFASDQTELTINGDFLIAAEGASNQNIPLFRLFDAGGTRRLSLYRQDGSGGIYRLGCDRVPRHGRVGVAEHLGAHVAARHRGERQRHRDRRPDARRDRDLPDDDRDPATGQDCPDRQRDGQAAHGPVRRLRSHHQSLTASIRSRCSRIPAVVGTRRPLRAIGRRCAAGMASAREACRVGMSRVIGGWR